MDILLMRARADAVSAALLRRKQRLDLALAQNESLIRSLEAGAAASTPARTTIDHELQLLQQHQTQQDFLFRQEQLHRLMQQQQDSNHQQASVSRWIQQQRQQPTPGTAFPSSFNTQNVPNAIAANTTASPPLVSLNNSSSCCPPLSLTQRQQQQEAQEQQHAIDALQMLIAQQASSRRTSTSPTAPQAFAAVQHAPPSCSSGELAQHFVLHHRDHDATEKVAKASPMIVEDHHHSKNDKSLKHGNESSSSTANNNSSTAAALFAGLRRRRTATNSKREYFPERLYRILMECEEGGLGHIIHFSKSGTAVVIQDPDVFERQILPCYFGHGRLCSFKRQLHIYGFCRRQLVTTKRRGSDGTTTPAAAPRNKMDLKRNKKNTNNEEEEEDTQGAGGAGRPTPALVFSHPDFCRDHPENCATMERVNKPPPTPLAKRRNSNGSSTSKNDKKDDENKDKKNNDDEDNNNNKKNKSIIPDGKIASSSS